MTLIEFVEEKKSSVFLFNNYPTCNFVLVIVPNLYSSYLSALSVIPTIYIYVCLLLLRVCFFLVLFFCLFVFLSVCIPLSIITVLGQFVLVLSIVLFYSVHLSFPSFFFFLFFFLSHFLLDGNSENVKHA